MARFQLFSDMTYEERLQQTLDHDAAVAEVLADLASKQDNPRTYDDQWGEGR